MLIGERINPTGKKRLAEALRAGDLSVVREEAIAQVAAGADILDVNVGATGVDEVTMLPLAVQAVAEVVDVPLCIDSRKVKALRGGAGRLPGPAHRELGHRGGGVAGRGAAPGQGVRGAGHRPHPRREGHPRRS